MIAIKNKCTLL